MKSNFLSSPLNIFKRSFENKKKIPVFDVLFFRIYEQDECYQLEILKANYTNSMQNIHFWWKNGMSKAASKQYIYRLVMVFLA